MKTYTKQELETYKIESVKYLYNKILSNEPQIKRECLYMLIAEKTGYSVMQIRRLIKRHITK